MATTQSLKSTLSSLTSITKPSIFQKPYSERKLPAIVVSSGLMAKTVKVSIGIQEWNNHIKKKFSKNRYLLVHDPNESLRTGDVISISPGWRASKTVHHVVDSIIAPFGPPASARPPVMTLSERLADREEKARLKAERKGRTWSAGIKARKEKIRREIMGGVDVEEAVGREWEELMRAKPVAGEGEAAAAEEEEWKALRKQTILMTRARKRMVEQTAAARRTKEILDERRRKEDVVRKEREEDDKAIKEIESGLEDVNIS